MIHYPRKQDVYRGVIFAVKNLFVSLPIMKAIYLTDLAQQYFPKSSARSAVAQLRRWIVLNEDLQQRLTELHFHKGQRSLTPLQHEAICHFLGEPGE